VATKAYFFRQLMQVEGAGPANSADITALGRVAIAPRRGGRSAAVPARSGIGILSARDFCLHAGLVPRQATVQSPQ
jgi:hypothetical protein